MGRSGGDRGVGIFKVNNSWNCVPADPSYLVANINSIAVPGSTSCRSARETRRGLGFGW